MTTARKNIVVTGGAGFLGLHLVRALVALGHHVIVIDSLATSAPSAERELFDLNVPLLRADLSEHMPRLQLSNLLLKTEHGHAIDAVAHLACPASPVDYWARPLWTMLTCSEGTRRVLELCRDLGHKETTFLLASTSEVYGDPGVEAPRAIPETYHGDVAVLGERACYDEGKRFAEALTMEFGLAHQLDVRIARIHNTYGPGMRPGDGRMLPAFLLAALRGEPLPVHGAGSQSRTLTHVADTTAALVQLLLTPPGEVPTMRVAPSTREVRVFNVCAEQETSVSEVAHEVWRAVREGPRPKLPELARLAHQENPSPHDPKRRLGDTTRLRSIGWAPTVSLRAGLADLAAWAAQEPDWMLAATTSEFVW